MCLCDVPCYLVLASAQAKSVLVVCMPDDRPPEQVLLGQLARIRYQSADAHGDVTSTLPQKLLKSDHTSKQMQADSYTSNSHLLHGHA